MDTTYLDHLTHLHLNPEIGPQTFAMAHAIRQINILIVNGGSYFDHPENETSVAPQVIADFVQKAMLAKGYFEGEWAKLQVEITEITTAWEAGKQQFPKDFEEATSQNVQSDFYEEAKTVLRMYAEPEAHRYWPARERCQWFINGYMASWREWQARQEQSTDTGM